jgi:hypothetical protein
MAESTVNCLFLISVDLIRIETGILRAQDFAGIEIHGWVTQGFLSSSQNNDLTLRSSAGSLQWTDGAVCLTHPLA